jgi:hypothetical protein
MIDDVSEMIETLEAAAQYLRRLGRGSLKNGSESILAMEGYLFDGRGKTAHSFPHDVCFETANRVEEYAARLKRLITPDPLQS